MAAPMEILIVGTGIAGPTVAMLLLLSNDDTLPPHLKPHITILERSPHLRSQGQNIDIRCIGVQIIRNLGLLPAVKASTTGEIGVRVVDSSNRTWAAFSADPDGNNTAGPTSDYEIMRGRLGELLYQQCQAVSNQIKARGGAGVDFIFGDHLDSITQTSPSSKVTVHFAKRNTTQDYDLVIGADGLQSSTRRLAFDSAGSDERCIHSLDMYGAFFSMPRSPQTDTLWRRFYHAGGGRGIMLRPNKPAGTTTAFMALYGSPDRQRLAAAAKSGRAGLEEAKKLMAEAFEGCGWESGRVIREMVGADDLYYDQIAQIRLDSWRRGRVVLLGDAGYCASPLSGMGTTLALAGSYYLAGALGKQLSASGSDAETKSMTMGHLDVAMEEYELNMRPLVTKAQKLKPGFPGTLFPRNLWGVWLLRGFAGFLYHSGLISLLLRVFKSPGEEEVLVEEYGFNKVPELKAV